MVNFGKNLRLTACHPPAAPITITIVLPDGRRGLKQVSTSGPWHWPCSTQLLVFRFRSFSMCHHSPGGRLFHSSHPI